MKKIIISLIIILLILFTFNFIRNLFLLNILENSSNNINLENLYINENMITPTQSCSFQIFKKDNIVLINQYSNNALDMTSWKNYTSNEEKAFDSKRNEVKFPDAFFETQMETIIFRPFQLKHKILYSLCHIIKVNNDIITLSDSNVSYSYNKNNGFLVKVVNNDAFTEYYSIELGNVKDSDIIKP